MVPKKRFEILLRVAPEHDWVCQKYTSYPVYVTTNLNNTLIRNSDDAGYTYQHYFEAVLLALMKPMHIRYIGSIERIFATAYIPMKVNIIARTAPIDHSYNPVVAIGKRGEI